MSKMKSILGLLTVAAMMGETNYSPYPESGQNDGLPKKGREKRLNDAERQRNLRQGQKMFTYYDFDGTPVEVWARNEKNADRKAKNLSLVKIGIDYGLDKDS